MVEKTFTILQLMFVSFVSDIIQFTFVVSMSILSFIKINADTVGFHITQVLTEPGIRYFHDANRVLNETFLFKCFFRAEFQNTTLICDAKVFEMEIIDKLSALGEYGSYLKSFRTGNL